MFNNKGEVVPLTKNAFHRWNEHTSKLLGIPHSCVKARRTGMACYLAKMNSSIFTIANVLRHSSKKTTTHHYVDLGLNPENKRKLFKRIAIKVEKYYLERKLMLKL